LELLLNDCCYRDGAVSGLREFYLSAVRSAETTYRGFLGWWVATACRFRWPVIVLFVAAATYGGHYSAQHLGMNVDTAGMLSSKLPFQQRSITLGKAFPQFTDNILIVIDAATPDQADDAAAAVVRFMEQRPKQFLTVFDPEGDPFFRRNGLLYLNKEELNDLADRLAAAQRDLLDLHLGFLEQRFAVRLKGIAALVDGDRFGQRRLAALEFLDDRLQFLERRLEAHRPDVVDAGIGHSDAPRQGACS